MKLNKSLNKNKFKSKHVNISKILNNNLFLKSSSTIQMALNKDRLLKRDFGIKRAKPKIDIGKNNKKSLSLSLKRKNFLSQENNSDNNLNLKNKNIPFELADILDRNKIKFEKVFEIFNDMKNKNNIFILHWNYVQKIKEKLRNKEKKLMFSDGSTEYNSTYKKYDFSTRDQIELELQKKLSANIFKSNPLMINNTNDMFFHFVRKYKDKNLVFNEQHPIIYLTKLKELLDYMQNEDNYNVDEKDKNENAQSIKYLMNHERKMEEEKIKLEEDQKKQDIIDNLKSKKMIHETKSSLKTLINNKNFFEDPYYFSKDNINNNYFSSTMYKNKTKNFLTPNKLNMMNKSSLEFFNRDKNDDKSKYNIIKLLRAKKNNLINHFSSCVKGNSTKNNKSKKVYSSSDIINNSINLSSAIQKKNNESYSKDSSIKTGNKTNNISTINKSHTINIKLSKKPYNHKNLPSIQKLPICQSLSLKNDQCKSNISSFYTPKVDSSSNNRSKNNNDSSRLSIRKSLLNESINKNDNKNILEIKDKEKELNKKILKNHISELYDIARNEKELSEMNFKKIKNFINQKEMKYKKKKNTVNLIKDLQILSDGFDINKVVKNIEDIPTNEIKQIKNFKNINIELNKLDKEYVKQICQFKAKNERKDGQEEF